LHVTDLNIVTPKPIIQPIYEQSHLIVVTRRIPETHDKSVAGLVPETHSSSVTGRVLLRTHDDSVPRTVSIRNAPILIRNAPRHVKNVTMTGGFDNARHGLEYSYAEANHSADLRAKSSHRSHQTHSPPYLSETHDKSVAGRVPETHSSSVTGRVLPRTHDDSVPRTVSIRNPLRNGKNARMTRKFDNARHGLEYSYAEANHSADLRAKSSHQCHQTHSQPYLSETHDKSVAGRVPETHSSSVTGRVLLRNPRRFCSQNRIYPKPTKKRQECEDDKKI
jgi:hypothetical protein